MLEIVSGHKVTNCDGKWIDVGTLLSPRDQQCSACRGRRQKPFDEPDYLNGDAVTRVADRYEEWTPEELTGMSQEELEQLRPSTRWSSGIRLFGYVLVAASVSAAITLTVLWMYTRSQ